jgi:HAE1 family hydrophobic/amphiphilic exporter-1
MGIIRFAIHNPVKVAVGVLLLLLFGAVSLYTIPVQLTPNVSTPIISIETQWTGTTPEEIEREIIEEQEDVLKGVNGLTKMTATAEQGQSTIELEFQIGTDMTRALQDVSNKLNEVEEYPDDADEPAITLGEADEENAIAWIMLDSEDPDYNIQGFYDLADRRVKPLLERVDGVAEVQIYGGREQQVHVAIDPHELAQRGITFARMVEALRGENVNVSAGELANGNKDVRIRTVGRYDALDKVRQTIVTYQDGGPVRVADLGEVTLTLEKQRSFVRYRGDKTMAIPVTRETGANVMSVMAGLKDQIKHINGEVLPRLEPNATLSLNQVYDQTVYIEDAIALVQANLFVGGALAVLVLLLFLRTVRPTIVVALAIPISVIGAFVIMAGLGRNINVISLAGLAFAVGLVVDSAIVVLENIDRHLQMGKKPGKAALDATGEVWGAILASVLTTVMVFVPVLTIQQEAGQLFRDIAIAICAAVLLALIVAVTVIPTASARFLKTHTEGHPDSLKERARRLFGLTPILGRLANGFASAIYELTSRDKVMVTMRVVIVAVFTFASIGGAWYLMPPTTYLPSGNRNLVFGIIMNPPGYNIAQSRSVAQRVEDDLRPYWEAQTQSELADLPPVVNPMSQQKVTNIPPIENVFVVAFRGMMFMGATSKEKTNVKPLGGLATTAMFKVPGTFGFAEQQSIFGRGLGGTNTIDVDISATDMESLRRTAGAIEQRLVGQFGKRSIRPEPLNYNLPGPELQVKIDRVRAADLGVDTSLVGLGVQALIDGAIVGDYRYRGDNIDLLLKRDESGADLPPEQMGQIPLATAPLAGGGTRIVPLDALAAFKHTNSPQSIRRIEQMRTITLKVTPRGNIPLETAMNQIDGIVTTGRDAGWIPSDVNVDLAGTADKLSQVRASLLGEWHGLSVDSLVSLGGSRMFLALLVTFLLMAALFESYLYPLVIMFSVPLATVGGFLGLAITHHYYPEQQLDTLTMLGFVILIGIVVNNAILIVHQALNFMRGVGNEPGEPATGLAPREAIRESVRVRIRPIFMTTITSAAGMLPLVVSGPISNVVPGLSSSGSELYRGLGSVVVGGLVVATLFTLVVVPLLFSLVLDGKLAVERWLGAEAEAVHTGPATE